jgi:hypothetical protein
MKIAGVEFQRGIVEWEDAFKLTKASASTTIAIVRGPPSPCPNLRSGPWHAIINNHMVICHEFCAETGTGDFTVVPICPRIVSKNRADRLLAKSTVT